MAHNVDYSSTFLWAAPGPLRGFEATHTVIRWFIRHSTTAGGWVNCNFLVRSDGELQELTTAVPDLGVLSRSLGSFRTLLFHLSSPHRFNEEQMTTINALITGWSDDAITTLSGYCRDLEPDATPYQMLCRWAELTTDAIRYLMEKTAHAAGILTTYAKFREQADILPDLINQMIIGRATKLECQHAGGLALDRQGECRQEIVKYFTPAPPYDDWPTLAEFFSTLVPGTICNENYSIAQLKGFKNAKTLHRRIIADSPPSFNKWQEYGEACDIVDQFFKFLMATPTDPHALVLSRLPLKVQEVELMSARVDIVADDDSVEKVAMLMEDLILLGTSINAMYETSVPWTIENFGCTRELLGEWRVVVAKRKKTLEKQIRKQQEEEKSITEIYSKNLKSRKLPDISGGTWSRFLSLWKTEAENYPTDAAKLAVLRDRMTVASDKTATEGMSSLEVVLAFLYNRYGSPNSIMADSLDELEQLGSPENGAHKRVEENIVSVSAVIQICDKDPELTVLWTSARLGRIVNNSLSMAIKIKFWASYGVFKSDTYDEHLKDGHTVASDAWESVFDKEYSTKRIQFFATFLNRELDIIRNLGIGSTGKKSGGGAGGGKPPHLAKLVSPSELFKCPFCQTKHKSDKKPCRPYLSVCEVWKKMSTEKMIQGCRQYKYCQVCTMSLDSRGHDGDGCPRKEQFKCKSCPSPQCLTHCDLLCRQQVKAKKLNQQPPNGGGGGGGRGGNGGGGGGGSGGGGRGQGDQGGSSGGGPYPGSSCDTTVTPYQSKNTLGYGGFGGNGSPRVWKPDPVNETDWAKSFRIADPSDGWLSRRNYFQPIFLGSLLVSKGQANCLMLSDNGSSIAFADTQYMAEIGVSPLGDWTGILETITQCQEVTLPFYKLVIKLKDSSYKLFALGCEKLGSREEIPCEIIQDIAKMFKVNASEIFRGGGRVRLLLGQDSASLLMRPLTHIRDVDVSTYLPEFARDLTLNTTSASAMLNVAGSIGAGVATDNNTSVFNCKIKQQCFEFYDFPEPEDIKWISDVHGNTATHKVKVATPACQGAIAPLPPNPPSGGGGPAGGPFPGGSKPVTPLAITQGGTQPPKEGSSFNIRTLTSKIRAIVKRKCVANFPKLAILLLSFSLLGKPASADQICVTGQNTTAPAFSSSGRARYASVSVSQQTGFQGSSWTGTDSLPPTAAVLCRKQGWLLGLNCLSAATQLLADPKFMKNYSLGLDVDEDPDSRALLTYLQCDACQERSRRCQGCKWLNSTASIQELEELEAIRKCIKVLPDKNNPGRFIVQADYPYIGDLPTLYSSDKSNYRGAVSTTKQLFRKLHKTNKVNEFHAEIIRSIAEGHMELLSPEDEAKVLANWHCFSFLNFQLKDSSSSQKVRPVTNSSAPHVSGSSNSRSPRGPNLLCNLRYVWESFRLKRWVAVSDLSRCYRCMHTSEETNNMRLMVYPCEPLNPDNQQFQVLRMSRCTYGDQICSCLLECIVRDIIAPACSTALGREILESGRYVDDISGGDDDQAILDEAMKDISDTLEKYGFSFKMLLTNYMKFKPDGSSECGQVEAGQDTELVFHHSWNFRTDEVKNIPNFNVHNKIRGSYAGPGLLETDVDALKITKRLVSRLMGQAFSIDGSFLSPLKATFAVFFSQVCQLHKEWDEPVQTELAEEIKAFVKVLKEKIPNITPTPRCLVPAQHHPVGLDAQSDGSLYLSSWVIYLISAMDINPDLLASWVLGAAAKVKHHSVVGNEMLGLFMVMENIVAYVFAHSLSLFRLPAPFTIRIGSDSECCLYTLNPLRLNKSVLIKNAVRGIHSFASDVTTKYPHVKVLWYHTTTDRNCADLNSKIPPDLDPISIMESPFWRNGLEEFKQTNWPPMETIFLVCEEGVFTWHKGKDAGAASNCVQCHNVLCGTETCKCQMCKPAVIMKNISVPAWSLNWKVILDNLPVLTPNHMESLLVRRTLPMAIRSVARYLSLALPGEMLQILCIPPKWYQTHMESTKTLTNPHEIMNSEINATFEKCAFLTLIKASNAQFKPTGTLASEEVGNITLATIRYSEDGMERVFQTRLLPIISSKHKLLLYRCFQSAHILRTPGPGPNLDSTHLSPSITSQRFKTGKVGALFSYMRNTLSKWCSQCPFCIRAGNATRPFSHSSDDPRILSLLDVECPVYHTISIDLFTEVWVLPHSKARGKPSYPVHILIIMDLISKGVAFEVLDGAKMPDVIAGLQQLGCRYRLPSLVIMDSGPQLRHLGTHDELISALNANDMKLVICPQGHQFSNFGERGTQEAKKILRVLREDMNKSLYRQPQTLLQLLSKLRMVEAVMSLRPILGSTSSDEQVVLTPRRLTHPFVSGETMNMSAVQILAGIFEPDHLISQLGKSNSAAKGWLQQALLDYLQTNAIRYEKPRLGDKQKPTHGNCLKPLVGDVVLYLDSNKVKRFGLIMEILAKNQVLLRSKLNNIQVDRPYHIRLISLLYRPSEWTGDISKL